MWRRAKASLSVRWTIERYAGSIARAQLSFDRMSQKAASLRAPIPRPRSAGPASPYWAWLRLGLSFGDIGTSPAV